MKYILLLNWRLKSECILYNIKNHCSRPRDLCILVNWMIPEWSGSNFQWSLSLTGNNVIPSWISIYMFRKVWDEITYGMAKWFHPTLFWAYNYLCMMGLKSIHWGHRCSRIKCVYTSGEIAARRIPQNTSDDKSTLIPSGNIIISEPMVIHSCIAI